MSAQDSQKIMSTSSITNSNLLIREAVTEVGVIMTDIKYAVVGGAACVLLGSDRVTQNVDIVVPKGKTAETRAKFRMSDKFTVEAKTAHTYYKEIKIEILSPPVLFQDDFDSSTPVIQVNGVSVLKPSLILNAKCKSLLGRFQENKEATDAADIIFLLEYLTANFMKPAPAEVPNITRRFVAYFSRLYKSEQKWIEAGYNTRSGTFEAMTVLH